MQFSKLEAGDRRPALRDHGRPGDGIRRAIRALAALVLLGGALALGADASEANPRVVHFDNNHDFVTPIKPPSAVVFNLTVDPHKVKAGATADIEVTLKLNDKPASDAAVTLAMLFTPGNDYTFTPDHGVTDINGVFKARVKVSKHAGNSVIAATTGVLSDQDHVTSTGADGKVAAAPTTSNPAQRGGIAPLVLLGGAALAVAVAGFYLNRRSMGA